MENTINFGIDLGTTNSAIGKFIKGQVNIYTNPRDYGRSTLPSVVAFRKDKVIVGSKAKERLERDTKNVVSVFKRKMGTSESYPIKTLNQSKTPVELSAYVLKELKTFIQTGETIDAAVVTIPASFDTIQSNATKEAGIQAGIKNIVLLQEPIAASLAFANDAKETKIGDGQWLVYDLGGGTFDVALVKIQDGEMKILDHEGDNFLGGADFDRMIVEKIIVPHLEKEGEFNDLINQMKSASGKYNGLYFKCLYKAEQAKVELSNRTSTEIELEGVEDEEGEELELIIPFTRSEFESLIKETIDETIELVKKIITRNSLTPEDLQFVLMIGGSTFIPYVRSRVGEMIGVDVNCEIDPTTAVAIGAAYYAGTKPKTFVQKKKVSSSGISVKMAYQKATQEEEEFFAAKIKGNVKGLFYRIDREDGGYSTGLKPLRKQITEELPLVEQSYNFFTLTIYDEQNNVISTDAEPIGIAHGKFMISGQSLPEDICLEVDDEDNLGKTKLELIFQKNSVLPIKKTITKELNRNIYKGSDEVIRINILEGPQYALPEANKTIGYMEINGSQISRNLSKGSDIEISLEISESRDLMISTYLVMIDQEFQEVFKPTQRSTSVALLKEQTSQLTEKLNAEIKEAEEREDYETAKELNKIRSEMEEVQSSASSLTNDDVTDVKYQLEDKKRKLAQEIDSATKDKRIQVAKKEYLELKERCIDLVSQYGNDYEQNLLHKISQSEEVFLNTNNPTKIREKTDELHAIMMQVLWRTPDFLVSIFKDLVTNHLHRMNDRDRAMSFADAGKYAIQNQNWERLAEVNSALINLLPKSAQREVTTKVGF